MQFHGAMLLMPALHRRDELSAFYLGIRLLRIRARAIANEARSHHFGSHNCRETVMTPGSRMGLLIKVGAGAAMLGFALASGVIADDNHVVVSPDALKWMPAPPAFPPGQEFAVLAGDPGKAASYVARARAPAGYKVPPHTHPGDESLTVLSGSLHIGTGDTFDESKGTTVKAGGFVLVAKGMPHYVWFTEPSVIQAHGMGPVTIDYVNPADDPRKK